MLFCAVLGPVQISAGGFGSIEGFVKDANTQQPIRAALVKVVVGQGIQVTTDNNGYYLFSNTIPSGKYTVIAVASGYAKHEVKGVSVSSGTKILNISLYKL
jgi:hypothetical protein